MDVVYIYENKDLKNMPDYYLESIDSIKLKECVNLHVLTTGEVKQIKGNFKSITIKKLKDDNESELKKFGGDFRNNFYYYTLKRFFTLKDYMEENNLTNVFLSEGDIYYQLSFTELFYLVPDQKELCVCRDNPRRALASTMYIPNARVLKKFTDYILERINTENKMYNDMVYLGDPELNLNSFCTEPNDTNIIVDAACFGQCLFGIDPRNGPSVPGFINETSTFKPDLRKFCVKNGVICYDNNVLASIHLHCKIFARIKNYLQPRG